jgi:hypothetical protein
MSDLLYRKNKKRMLKQKSKDRARKTFGRPPLSGLGQAKTQQVLGGNFLHKNRGALKSLQSLLGLINMHWPGTMISF